ncbi:MAG TPA: alpha/beta-hydrolase family protein [Acidimicrobiales bacterium]|nr:alpha/beta-hydrolase family protein [Acidimicrobiales bacterium]
MARPMDPSLAGRAEQVGALVATLAVPDSFQRTLMPRSTLDQALITGLSFTTLQTVTTLLQDLIQAGASAGGGRGGSVDPASWGRRALLGDLGAVAMGTALERALPARDDESLGRAAARTAGRQLAVTGAAGLAVGTAQLVGSRWRWSRPTTRAAVAGAAGAVTLVSAARQRRDRREAPADDAGQARVLRSLALGVGVTAGASALHGMERRLADVAGRGVARVAPGAPAVWRPVGHALAVAALATGVRVVVQRSFSKVESHEVAVEAAFDVPPLQPERSGSLVSLVPFDSLAKQGRRFVWSAVHPSVMTEVLGDGPTHPPVRVYVGLESADSEAARVAIAVRELERTGAFDRSWLLVASPTGTGYVNYAAVSALELLSRGDCATVAMQYAARPSVMSLDRVDEGHRHARLLLQAIHTAVARRPTGSRPRVVLFGESLGAWTSQDAAIDRGTDGLRELGVDHAIWIGTPYFSKWKEQVLRDRRDDVDPSLVGVFEDIDEYRALPEPARARLRYVMITHANDGVAHFGPELLWRAPPWLGDPAQRPATVPTTMRWRPVTTFFQVLVDMKNSANVVPGRFAATGHDYRADLLPFIDAVLGFDAPPEQLARIGEWLEANELERSRWVDRHGRAGASMAAMVVRSWMEEHPDEAERALGPRLRAIAAQDAV